MRSTTSERHEIDHERQYNHAEHKRTASYQDDAARAGVSAPPKADHR
jgi:hypothetical protein